jgi:hypothetical protein
MRDRQVPSPMDRQHPQSETDYSAANRGYNDRIMQHAALCHDRRAAKRGHGIEIRSKHGENFGKKHIAHDAPPRRLTYPIRRPLAGSIRMPAPFLSLRPRKRPNLTSRSGLRDFSVSRCRVRALTRHTAYRTIQYNKPVGFLVSHGVLCTRISGDLKVERAASASS